MTWTMTCSRERLVGVREEALPVLGRVRHGGPCDMYRYGEGLVAHISKFESNPGDPVGKRQLPQGTWLGPPVIRDLTRRRTSALPPIEGTRDPLTSQPVRRAQN